MADVRETLHVHASPDAVYDLVADLPRMGEWSPECEKVTWRGDATRAVKGGRFVGHNRSGVLRWTTSGEVVVADRGRQPRLRGHGRTGGRGAVGVLLHPRRGR